MSLFIEQALNAFQLSVTLLMIASGLTLVFGTMHFLNLAHGSFFMIGAYGAAWATALTGNWLIGLGVGVGLGIAVGLLTELAVVRRLYKRDHLEQVLVTFGLILFFNEAVRLIWGIQPLALDAPSWLSGSIPLPGHAETGAQYPVYRLFVILCGFAALGVLYWVILRTKLGLQVRAGATDFEMIEALGVPITRLNMALFAIGCGLAAFAGVIAAPFIAIQSGMGEPMLILAFVVVVIGGIGSLRGAFVGALLVGFVDSFGRAYLPKAFALVSDGATASGLAAALSSMLIFLVMAVVLAIFPSGLFGQKQN